MPTEDLALCLVLSILKGLGSVLRIKPIVSLLIPLCLLDVRRRSILMATSLRRTRDLGANTPTGVPCTKEQIMAMVRKGKQRGTFSMMVGFWTDRTGMPSLSISVEARTPTLILMRSGGGEDDEQGMNEDAGRDEDADWDAES
nr:hypothetical protein [Tanacetum cinerariifolium]